MEQDGVVPGGPGDVDEVRSCSRCRLRPVRAPGQRYCAGCHARANRESRARAGDRLEAEVARRVALQLAAERGAVGRFGR